MSIRRFPGAVESAADLPPFCSYCGRRLVAGQRREGFDPRTGEPRLVAYAFCRGSWLERLFRDPDVWHDQFVVSPRPPADWGAVE